MKFQIDLLCLAVRTETANITQKDSLSYKKNGLLRLEENYRSWEK